MEHGFAARMAVGMSLWLVLIGGRSLHAQPTANRSADETAIRQAGKDYLAAIDRGDNKAQADAWTVSGTFTDESGRTVKVRELLEQAGKQPSSAAARPASSNVKIRFLSNDAAVEEGDCASPTADGTLPTKGRYMVLWVRQGGRWKLDNLKEWRVPAGSKPDHLASLGVLAGEWSGTGNGITIRIAAKWDANKKFMQREVTLSGGKSSLIGTQRIGWDPLTQQIRSWTFSDDGSVSEGVWSMEGNAWMALTWRAMPDGSVSSATQVYRFPDKNTLVWKVIGGSVDGQPTDDFEVALKRAAAR